VFYNFRQNNSGGGFIIDEKAGISVTVIIEADNAEDANSKALDIGLYFDGCDDGRDCPCCGDRWHGAWADEGDEVPCEYGRPLIEVGSEEHKAEQYYWRPMAWAGDRPEVFVHLKDGRFFGFHMVNGQYVYRGDGNHHSALAKRRRYVLGER